MKLIIFTTLDKSNLLIKNIISTGLVSDCIQTKEAAERVYDANIILINWPYILRDNFIARQRFVLNVHNSILPKYRGRHAFTWAILNGEKYIGFSLHVVTADVDAGDVLDQISFSLAESEDINDAFRYGNALLHAWLPEKIKALYRGDLKPVKQVDSDATYFRKRTDEDNWLPSFSSAKEIKNFVRAVAPPYTLGAKIRSINGEVFRVRKAELVDDVVENASVGSIVSCRSNELTILCEDGLLRLYLDSNDISSCFWVGMVPLTGKP